MCADTPHLSSLMLTVVKQGDYFKSSCRELQRAEFSAVILHHLVAAFTSLNYLKVKNDLFHVFHKTGSDN